MSRLQAGGLALILKATYPENLMKVVKLVGFQGEGITVGFGFRKDYWIIEGDFERLTFASKGKGVAVPAEYLLPLGDEEGRKLYKLEEEKLESKNVTTL
ncbi:putative phosphotransferase [Acinetobacter phage BS46]|nr:putative phosphotransferase [Acinetobacter phage BS46]